LLAGDGLIGDKRGVVGIVLEGGDLVGAAIKRFKPTNASRFSRNKSAADQLRVLNPSSLTLVRHHRLILVAWPKQIVRYISVKESLRHDHWLPLSALPVDIETVSRIDLHSWIRMRNNLLVVQLEPDGCYFRFKQFLGWKIHGVIKLRHIHRNGCDDFSSGRQGRMAIGHKSQRIRKVLKEFDGVYAPIERAMRPIKLLSKSPVWKRGSSVRIDVKIERFADIGPWPGFNIVELNPRSDPDYQRRPSDGKSCQFLHDGAAVMRGQNGQDQEQIIIGSLERRLIRL